MFTYYAERMSPIKNIQLFQDSWYSINVFSQVDAYFNNYNVSSELMNDIR
jgi:hypothetical protein